MKHRRRTGLLLVLAVSLCALAMNGPAIADIGSIEATVRDELAYLGLSSGGSPTFGTVTADEIVLDAANADLFLSRAGAGALKIGSSSGTDNGSLRISFMALGSASDQAIALQADNAGIEFGAGSPVGIRHDSTTDYLKITDGGTGSGSLALGELVLDVANLDTFVNRQSAGVVGIGATTGAADGTLHTSGLILGLVTKTGAYTATAADYTILCDATSAAFTVTLPAAATAGSGTVYVIKKTDSSGNAVTIDGNGSETIDGATTQSLAAQYDSLTITTDGTEWWIQ